MPRYEIEEVVNNQRKIVWFETREEAVQHLKNKDVDKFFDDAPRKGGKFMMRKYFYENIDALMVKLAEAEGSEEILAWERKKD